MIMKSSQLVVAVLYTARHCRTETMARQLSLGNIIFGVWVSLNIVSL